MKILLASLLLISTSNLLGQIETNKIADSIVAEGKKLYKSEMASWYGTDIFLEKFKDQKENIGGYFSYENKNLSSCVFFSKGDKPRVLGTISFDSTFNVSTAQIDETNREFTTFESDIYFIRKIALTEINNDTLFKVYNNTNLNIIPVIDGENKKVYVLTGPKVNGVVVLGNDYLLTFNNQNQLVSKKQIHKNIIPINYVEEKGKDIVSTMHSHLPTTGDFMTSTDICTLLLYSKFAKWEQHIVISKNYVSIWDCEKKILVILAKEAWDKIYKNK